MTVLSPQPRMAVLLACAAVTVGAHVWLIFGGLVPALIARPLHLAVSLPWVFLFVASSSRAARWSGAVFTAVGLGATAYLMLRHRALADQYGSLNGSVLQYALAAALLLVVLEMARRAVQPVLPAVALASLLYAFFGQHLPASIGHPGVPMDYLLGSLVLAESGLWGSLTSTSIELIVPFMILGAFVTAGEAGTGFMSAATRLAGRFRAGAAKVSVLASAMYGTISGSASANVASVGAITIPAMKRMGYPPPFAAATEAVASTGGQIMPPVMGAGAFIMAELLRVQYSEIAIASILPALMFFAAAWIGIHFFSLRYDLPGVPADQMPPWSLVLRTVPFFLAPLGILVVMMMVMGYSPALSAMTAAGVTIVLLFYVGADNRLSASAWWSRFKVGLKDAAEQIAMIAAILLCAGIIVGVFNITGLGVKVTSLILDFSDGKLWVALLLTALACIVLGMELPTTAAYLICIAVAGPALEKLGLPALHGHMFVFWYALLCTITPPVCGTVFVAAGIAGAPWLQVAFQAMRIGLGLFIIPLGFIANPALLALQTEPLLALAAAAKVMFGLWLLSFALIQLAKPWWQSLLATAMGVATIFAFGING
jgi:TRAP transporter 4TM/12TM fusion protein